MIIKKVLRSFQHALRGFATVAREEHNFKIHILAALVVILCSVYFDFSFVESSLLILAIVMVLGAEIVNTAIEDLCNKVEPAHDPIIGKIKDTLAAFVLVTAVAAVIIGIMVFTHHFKTASSNNADYYLKYLSEPD
ncbi:MAG: hypothetical protein RL094_393 [Candidatus Parcubacteria bacterium]|jgi:diacylglycerol kinase